MDTAALRKLLDARDALDLEISEAVGGVKKERKPQSCSICSSTEHSARTCPQKGSEP